MAIDEFGVKEIMRGNALCLLFEFGWVMQIIIDPNDMLVEKYTPDIFSSLIVLPTLALGALRFGIARTLGLQKGFLIIGIVAHALGHAFMLVTFVNGLEVIARPSSAWNSYLFRSMLGVIVFHVFGFLYLLFMYEVRAILGTFSDLKF